MLIVMQKSDSRLSEAVECGSLFVYMQFICSISQMALDSQSISSKIWRIKGFPHEQVRLPSTMSTHLYVFTCTKVMNILRHLSLAFINENSLFFYSKRETDLLYAWAHSEMPTSLYYILILEIYKIKCDSLKFLDSRNEFKNSELFFWCWKFYL